MAMSTEEIMAEVAIPQSVKVTKEGSFVIAKGKLGTVKKDFLKLPATITLEGARVVIKPYGKRKRDLAVTNTARSIIASMIKGVEKGYTYKVKVIFAHFPISVKVKGKEVHVENFFGEIFRFSSEASSALGIGPNLIIQSSGELPHCLITLGH